MKTIDIGEASGAVTEYLKPARCGAPGLYGGGHAHGGYSDTCQCRP